MALVRRKMTVVRDQLFPQKPPGSRFRFSRTGVQPSPGSSTIELPSAFAESGAYPPDREPPGSPRQCSLPLACRHPPEGHQIGARKRRTHLKTPSSANHTAAASQPTGRIAKAASWLHLSRVSPALLPPERPSHTHTPKPGFGGRGARDACRVWIMKSQYTEFIYQVTQSRTDVVHCRESHSRHTVSSPQASSMNWLISCSYGCRLFRYYITMDQFLLSCSHIFSHTH